MPEFSRLCLKSKVIPSAPRLPVSPARIDFSVASLVVSVLEIVYEGPLSDPRAPKGLIFLIIWFVTLTVTLSKKWQKTFYFSVNLTSFQINIYITFSLVFWLLSFIFPVNRSIWQKRFYIITEIALIKNLTQNENY